MTSHRSSLRFFLQELKRRRVFRAGGWYAGSAFVVLQAADLMLPPLGAPDWIMSALVVISLLGLPVVLALAWAFDLTFAGLQRTARKRVGTGAKSAGPQTLPAPTPVTRWAGIALAAVVVLAVLTAGAVLYRRATAAVATDSVAVMPFTIRGAELGYLREGMVELLSRSLDGAGALRAVDPARVLLTVAQEHDSSLVDGSAGRRLSRTLEAGWFVVGSVVEAGGRVRIQAALHRQGGAPDAPPHTAQAEGPADSLFEISDRVAAGLLVHLGGRQGHRLTNVAAVTTPSLEAFKAYVSAEHHLRYARFDSALAGYRRATDLDPAFALAWYRLAIAGSWAGADEALVDAAAARARDHAGKLADRDRRLLDAFALFLQGDGTSAEAAYRAILRDYPDELEATFQLAEVLFHYAPVRGQPRSESYALFREVLRLDPEFLCPI